LKGHVFDEKQKIALQSSRSDSLVQYEQQNEGNRYEHTKRVLLTFRRH